MTEETNLLPCPFCGPEPSVSRRQDEDLATHNIVEWVCISCIECGSSHCEWPVTVEPGPIERWNTRAFSPPEPTEGQGDPENRMTQIDKVIADMQHIRERFGNTCVYIRRYGMSWGAVALNYKADDEKNGVFNLNDEYDRRLIAHSEQVERLMASRDEAYVRANKAEKELAALRAMPLQNGTSK